MKIQVQNHLILYNICYIKLVMGPKVQFTKEQIIETALEIVIEKGFDALSVRFLANELGSSVAPIYVNFKSSQDLLDAVLQKIQQIMWQYSTKEYCEYGFFNIGIGQLLLARDYPKLYLDLLLKPPLARSHTVPEKRVFEKMVEIMQEDPMLEGLSQEQCARLLEKMSVQTSGLAIAIAKEEPEMTVEHALQVMEETANQLIFAEKTGYSKSEQVKITLDEVL
jgi:AcrR family transcriptional regulator